MQLGVAPGPAVVLAGVDEGDELLLRSLDGAHDLRQLQQLAHGSGLGAARVPALLALLASAGLLVDSGAGPADRAHLTLLGPLPRARLVPDADALTLVLGTDGQRLAASRGRRRVVVRGAGRIGALIAGTLTAAGVGEVELVDERVVRAGDVLPGGASHDDVGGSWVAAAQRARARLEPAARATGHTADPADLVVLVAEGALDARAGDDLVRRDVPHLGVLVAPDRVAVGPLVLPGTSACLRCLDLHRRDRDPAWLHLLAQLLVLRPRVTGSPGGTGPLGETALSTMAAGLAALQVLGQLDGQLRPDAVGRTLEVSLPHGAVRRRSWTAHAACGCGRWQAPAQQPVADAHGSGAVAGVHVGTTVGDDGQ